MTYTSKTPNPKQKKEKKRKKKKVMKIRNMKTIMDSHPMKKGIKKKVFNPAFGHFFFPLQIYHIKQSKDRSLDGARPTLN
jgi:hypothetical protein